MDDLFLPDPLAHFVPIRHCEVELTQLDVELFSFLPVIRYNQLRLMYRTIQGLLENIGTNSLEKLRNYAEQHESKVALTSTLAFLFVALDHYLAFKNHIEDDRILQVEMNRLVTIVMCALPNFEVYIRPTLPQMRLL